MRGFVVVNPEVLIARALERGGRYAPGLDFIRWRFAEIRRETIDDAEFWGLDRRDIARTRAEQLATERGANEPADRTGDQVPGITQATTNADNAHRNCGPS